MQVTKRFKNYIRKVKKQKRKYASLVKHFSWLFHVLFGIATVISAKISFVLPPIFFLTFVLYEFDEEWNLGDHAFEELREYGAGLFIGFVIIIATSQSF